MRSLREIVLRLEVQTQLGAFEGVPQIMLDPFPRIHLCRHLRGEELVGIPAVGLRPVEREVGVAQEGVGVGPVRRADGDPDAGADGDLVAFDEEGRGELLNDLARHRRGIFRAAQRCDDQGELVAAQPGRRIGVANTVPKPCRHRRKQAVADRMAKGVVHILELIEVEKQKRQRLVRTARARKFALQPFEEQRPVGQAGQNVLEGQPLDVLFRSLAVDGRRNHRRDRLQEADVVHREPVRLAGGGLENAEGPIAARNDDGREAAGTFIVEHQGHLEPRFAGEIGRDDGSTLLDGKTSRRPPFVGDTVAAGRPLGPGDGRSRNENAAIGTMLQDRGIDRPQSFADDPLGVAEQRIEIDAGQRPLAECSHRLLPIGIIGERRLGASALGNVMEEPGIQFLQLFRSRVDPPLERLHEIGVLEAQRQRFRQPPIRPAGKDDQRHEIHQTRGSHQQMMVAVGGGEAERERQDGGHEVRVERAQLRGEGGDGAGTHAAEHKAQQNAMRFVGRCIEAKAGSPPEQAARRRADDRHRLPPLDGFGCHASRSVAVPPDGAGGDHRQHQPVPCEDALGRYRAREDEGDQRRIDGVGGENGRRARAEQSQTLATHLQPVAPRHGFANDGLARRVPDAPLHGHFAHGCDVQERQHRRDATACAPLVIRL